MKVYTSKFINAIFAHGWGHSEGYYAVFGAFHC